MQSVLHRAFVYAVIIELSMWFVVIQEGPVWVKIPTQKARNWVEIIFRGAVQGAYDEKVYL